jgi:hypothetical protein
VLDVVAETLPELCDRARQRVGRDERVFPDAVEELVLGDEAIAVRDQVAQNVHGFRLEQDPLVVFPDTHPA